MNKVHLIVLHWGPTGGIEAVNQSITRVLLESRCDVLVYPIAQFESIPSCEVVKCLEPPKGRITRSLWFRYLWRSSVARCIKRHYSEGDIVIFTHAKTLSLIPIFRSMSIHNNFWGWFHGIEIWGQHAIRLKTELRALAKIICVSEYTASHIRKTGIPNSIFVVPNCVDLSIFKPANARSEINQREILICGRISACERYKGHDELLRALARLREQGQEDISLKIVGDGDDRHRLVELSGKLGLSDRVEFTGKLSHEALVSAYQRCGVFCMPSRVEQGENGRWTGEGFGIVYIEAAACGRPVIGSLDGGASETVVAEKTGLLVNPKSVEEIAKAISIIFEDTERADVMGKAGREWVVENFSYERFKERILQLLEIEEE